MSYSKDYNEIIDSVYDAALTPEHFEILIRAWDATFIDEDVERFQGLLLNSMDMLSRHFQRADQIFLTTHNLSENTLEDIVNKQPTSAFICDAKGRIHALNKGARQSLNLSVGTSIYDLPFDVKAAEQLKKLFRSHHTSNRLELKSLALRALDHDNDFYQSLVLLVQLLPISNQLGHWFLFKSSVAVWHSGIEQALNSAFELTPAEIEVIKLLNIGLSLKDIAESRGRSLATVRTQIKNILQKTDTKSQTALMRHVTSLLIIAHSLVNDKVKASRIESSAELHQLHDSTGRLIQYRDFGAEQDQAVVCFTPNLNDMPNPEFLYTLLGAGIRLIALKDGEQPVSLIKDRQAFDRLMENYNLVLNHLQLSSAILLGHCAGGVYATEFARKFPDRVAKVVCIDTGAPLSSKGQWDKMAKTARRTFMVAKQCPSLLVWPHRLAAREFFSGPKGQQSIIEYVYGDNANDLALISDKPRIRQLIIDMLEYTLRDVKRPVRVAEMWVQDWSEALYKVTQDIPVVFVHGSDNRQFLLEDIEALATEHENIHVVVAQDAAQLTLITHLSDVVKGIKL